MQSYISVNLESSGRTESWKRKSKKGSLGAHYRDSPRERAKYWLRKVITVLFSQVGVGSLLVCYTILGAMMFISIESAVDSRRLSQVASLRSVTVLQLWNVTRNYNVIYGQEWKREVDHVVRRFQAGLVREIRLGYEGRDAKEPWTFPQALMFSLSVYTTIGYGNLTPKTDWGKATTCLYAIFGIPLLLLYMANVGDLLATSFRQFYRTLNRCKSKVNKMRELSRDRRRQRRQRLSLGGENEQDEKLIMVGVPVSRITAADGGCAGDNGKLGQQRTERTVAEIGTRSSRSQGEMSGASAIGGSCVNESTSRDNNEFEANEVTIPISTCLSVFFCYILLGSILFSWWEGWEYFEGSYFCFVSLVTIGFSDMVPGQGRISKASSSSSGKTSSSSLVVVDAAVDDLGGVVDASSRSDGSGRTSPAPGSNGREESLDHVDGQLILCSIYILFGMALMAMCFHLTQERFFTTAKKLGRALHLI